MNAAIDAIREATRGTDYEGRLFIVGGYVRDKLMGRPPSEDVDIVLEGNALELARFLHDKGIADYWPVTYDRFGTAMVSIAGHTVEMVGARREEYTPDSRKPVVEHASLYDDAFRRDFTINTLMENLHTGEILDLTGMGERDIRARIIRTPSDPEMRFSEDPLRMLRAVRFAVKLGFEIEASTKEAIKRNAPRLKVISAERIREEFVKIMLSEEAATGLRMLKELALLEHFAPELLAMDGVTQDGMHTYDVWEHTLHALQSLPPQAGLVLRLAVLFHDTGKPETKAHDSEGNVHFYGHEKLSARIAQKVMHRLRFPTKQIYRVARLVSMHMRIGEYRSEWNDSAVRRLIRDAGEDLSDLVALAIADRLGSGIRASADDIEELRERIEHIMLKMPIHELESPLDGREIMDLLQIEPGPKVREVKRFLIEQILEGHLSPGDKETASKMVLERFGARE